MFKSVREEEKNIGKLMGNVILLTGGLLFSISRKTNGLKVKICQMLRLKKKEWKAFRKRVKVIDKENRLRTRRNL
jgi:hypothetical protein